MISFEQATHLLTEITKGNHAVEEQLVPLVYAELRGIAARYMRRERPDHTLQPTALVNEAYLRLVGQQVDWRNRAHFLGIAADQMNRVLKDYGRRHKAAKRGGADKKVGMDAPGVGTKSKTGPKMTATVLLMREALERLAHKHPRQGRVAWLKFYCDCTEEEIGEIQGFSKGLSVETIRRDWRFAKAWLKAELE
jgi:RNA polymerase sigma-70 factor (ECF subfamily)